MATLTITVPDEMAQTIAALPDANRAAYLASINDFAVSLLTSNGTTVPADSSFGGQANGSGNTMTASNYHILDTGGDNAPFTEADGEALKEAFAAFDAGDRGKPAAQSFALVAARLGLKNTTL